MKKLLLAVVLSAMTSVSFALETVTLRFYIKKTKEVIEKVVPLTPQPDGGLRVKIPVKDIKPNYRLIDIVADCAFAQKGDKGFFVMGDSSYGEFIYDNGEYSPHHCHMPIFGMKSPNGTFVGIAKGLRHEQIQVVRADNGVYSIFFRYRFDTTQFLAYEDIVVDFYKLPDDAGYSEMAKVYRDYQLKRGEVKLLRERVKNNPALEYTAKSIYVRLRHCGKNVNPNNAKHHLQTPETEPKLGVRFTFDDMVDIMKRMKGLGMNDVEVCSVGWSTRGQDGRYPQYFPVEPAIGGEQKFREAIQIGKDMGYQINCHINQMAMFYVSDRWDANEVAKKYNGSFVSDSFQPSGRAFRVCWKRLYELWVKDDFVRMKNLGLNGIMHVDVTSAVPSYECHDPRHKLNKKQMARYMNKVNAYARKVFGGFASEGGMDHVIKHLDFSLYLWSYPVWEDNKERLATKYVPFWQLVYHGIVISNPYYTTIDAPYKKEYVGSNQRKAYDYLENPTNRWLKVVEYNGRPTFYYLNYKNLEPMKRAYDDYQKIRHLQMELMVHHSEISKNVFLTRYEFGDEVVVNYTDKPFTYKGQEVSAKGFKLFKKAN
ncbi:MAG: hypothetical protein E7035_05650 [Verrucomicrobiaceae bacterium]|nr:hypothetical protein [Verrucomicrobiaceae bacterium]